VPATEEAVSFASSRFVVDRFLGSGAFGDVYAAHDTERSRVVAIKVLHTATPDSLYRFKHEFRSLSGIRHRNLATLYELVEEEGKWILVMELVEGSELLEYLARQEISRVLQRDSPTLRLRDGVEGGTADAGDAPRLSSIYLHDLRVALKQLAEGVYALHAAGKLHRDLKPSNVLVTAEGRVVLLDFGLVVELDQGRFDESKTLVGTPGYIAPEITRGGAFTEASDWYAIGVILFQALTGRPPFVGSFFEILGQQQNADPEFSPGELQRIPADLIALCSDLLHRDPENRPSGAEIVNRLGGQELTVWLPPFRVNTIGHGSPFVGRGSELQSMSEAYRTASTSKLPQLVFISGTSGSGKTALLNEFFDQVRTGPDSFILATRCHEHESVPFKAVDGIVDSLTRMLRKMPAGQVSAVLPDDIDPLLDLFPVLASASPRLERPAKAGGETRDTQHRATVALTQLITNVSQIRPVVVAIDDAQWGDFDSAVILSDLLENAAARLVVVIASTTEDWKTSLFVQFLRSKEFGARRDVALEPLTESEAAELVRHHVSTIDAERSSIIVTESHGVPFWIERLSRYAATSSERPTLAAAVNELLSTLKPAELDLLRLISFAGQPLESRMLLEAVDTPASEREETIETLRKHRLIRTRLTGMLEEVEVYHSLVRKAVVELTGEEERRDQHRRLAAALEEAGTAESSTLARHYAAGGDVDRAFDQALSAAEEYARTRSFDRAVHMYSFAHELAPSRWSQAAARGMAAAMETVGRDRPDGETSEV
jgi:serine/threonine protein kinase